ncbi:MAG TPA: hypothetical protein ENN13_03725, partial [Candidatus Altiarchaeales archaeon]|nr:hypothetical protein [Candidatus Altiarchaeales archaeon]
MEFSDVKDFAGTMLGLTRPRNMLMAFIGVFTGAVLYTQDYNLLMLFAAALSASLILAGGNGMNDYFDFEIDRVNKPERPIPSGRITRSDAMMLSIVFFLSGLGLAKAVN